jgi:hypothetical protein
MGGAKTGNLSTFGMSEQLSLSHKGHEKILKQTKRCDDHCFFNVSWVHWHLMVPLYQIYHGEEFAAVEFGEQILDRWKGVSVMFCGQIQSSVIAAGAPRTVQFWHHVQQRRSGII